MPNAKLSMWTASVKEYCEKKGTVYKVPKKDTKQYREIRKIYDKKCKC